MQENGVYMGYLFYIVQINLGSNLRESQCKMQLRKLQQRGLNICHG